MNAAPAPDRVYRLRGRWIAPALWTLTVVLYSRSFFYGFISYDDLQYITENPHLRLGLTAVGLRWAFTTFWFANWSPLVWVVYLANASLFHSAPASLHVFNVLLHASNAALLFVALHRMTGRRWPALAVAALFACHPLRVQSVVWISETKDVLAGLFWMLTMLAYQRYVRQPRGGHYAVVLVMFALGLMSKPSVTTLPAVLLLLDFWPLSRVSSVGDLAKRCLEKVPLLVTAALASVLYLRAQRRGGLVELAALVPPAARLQNAVVSIGRYVLDTVWPADLCVFYPHPSLIGRPFSPVQVGGAGLGLLTFTAVAIGLWRTRRYLLIGWLWFVGALLPMLNVFAQAGDQARADRYTYLPGIGLTILIVWAGADLLDAWVGSARLRARLAAATGIAVCVALSTVTLFQIRFWQNTRVLFERADRVTWRNFEAKTILSEQAAHDHDVVLAVALGQSAVDCCSVLPAPHVAFGLALLEAKRPHEAYRQLLEAARLDPANARTRNDLGRALLELNRPLEAARQFEKAVQLDPDVAEAHSNWGVLLAAQNQLPAAVEQWKRATELDPTFGAAQGLLATALQRQGDRGGAVAHFRAAIDDGETRPEWETAFAWLLSTDPQTSLTDIAAAVTAAENAVSQAHPPDPLALDALAAAEARDGQFDQAAAHAAAAINLLGNRQPQLSADIARRIRLYQSGRVYVGHG